MSITTTTTGHISGSIRERLTVVKRRADLMWEAGSSQCQGLAACIIVTILLPELLREYPLSELKINWG
jgi:hypothetical protein